MKRLDSHKDAVWDLKTKIVGQVYDSQDFTNTNFNSAIFENTIFKNCLFEGTKVAGSKLFYESNFFNCEFKKLELSNTTFGSNQGVYEECLFEGCNFRGKEFNFTRFVRTTFCKCKLSKISFNASSFADCKFIGLLADVTFNGLYDTDKSAFPALENVNFSEAKFGEFVTFINCDLQNCIPPDGNSFDEILYRIYSNDSRVLSSGSKDKIVFARR